VKIAVDIIFEWRRWAALSAPQLYELLQFRQAIFVVEQASPYTDLDGRDASAEHLLARRGGSLIGCLRLIEPDPLVRIGRVAVTARAGEVYPHRDVAISAQVYLEPFYRSLGFVAISAPYDDCGIPHIDMVGPPRSG
jgi:ElaA protein